MRSFALLALPVVPLLVIAACGDKKPATWPQPSDASAEGAVAWGGEGGAPAGDIDTQIAAVAAKVAADMQKEGAFVRQNIAQGQHTKVDVTLKGDECYTIIAQGQPGAIGDLDMVMMFKDPATGQTSPVAQDQGTDATAILGVPPTLICPPKSLDVSLDLSAKTGAGAVGIGLYAKPNPQLKPTNPTVAGDPTGDLLTKNAGTMAKGMQAEGAVVKQTLKEGETFPFTVTLTAGRCYAIIAVSPKDGVTDIDMKMLMPPFFTMEVDRDKRTDNVAVIGSPSPQCPITMFPVPYRIDVTAKKGAGPVAVQLFSKSK
jgi:hypothetical protein